MKPVIIGNAELYLGDCLEILPTLGKVDAVITDPPYGVEFSGKAGHYRSAPNFKKHETYASFVDDKAGFLEVVPPTIDWAKSNSSCAAVFMADKSLPLLPPWAALGGIFMPNGCGLSSWGFQCFMHCAFYGKCPYLSSGAGSRPNGKLGVYGNDSNLIAHPCAKPLAAMEWAVCRASLDSWLVVDPFMGSGTTGVACMNLGRKFIGIEIEPKYFEIACRRIEDAQRQGRLFA